MKTISSRLLIVCAAALVVLAPSLQAQRQLGKKKGPTSKLYVAESKGESQIQNNDKIYTARQATAFDAPGTVIQTGPDSSNAIVYSNGTGMFIDQNTRVEIDRFVQEPFKPERNGRADAPVEPSVSQSDVFVARGAVGVCTSQLVSGSTMSYATPQGSVNIRGGKVSIATDVNATTIDLLEGDITVRGGGKDIGGQILRSGERAVIRPGPVGQPPSITITQIPPEARKVVDERVASACNAKKTVTFEVIEQKANQGLDAPPPEVAAAVPTSTGTTTDSGTTTPTEGGTTTDPEPTQEIVAKPTVPATLPTNVVISADRLPGK
ncbi:MAG: FecR domain-containing protein [bacterium]|nr:FecR domain-containing protein [bacterium]